MYLSQTFVYKHNYDGKGTFKIDSILVFASKSFSMEVLRQLYSNIKIVIYTKH